MRCCHWAACESLESGTIMKWKSKQISTKWGSNREYLWRLIQSFSRNYSTCKCIKSYTEYKFHLRYTLISICSMWSMRRKTIRIIIVINNNNNIWNDTILCNNISRQILWQIERNEMKITARFVTHTQRDTLLLLYLWTTNHKWTLLIFYEIFR